MIKTQEEREEGRFILFFNMHILVNQVRELICQR
jgi:hypothetical protein